MTHHPPHHQHENRHPARFHVHRAERSDLLADALAGLLSQPLPDPFEVEVVVVAAHGTERWLSQRLSHRLGTTPGGSDGVCAGVRFVRPTSVVAELLGIDDTDPWRPEALLWSVLAELDAAADEPWLGQVAAHLGRGQAGDEGRLRRVRRLAVARQLALLLHGYSRQRPAMTAGWTTGLDEDGLGVPLPADLRWQAELWRRVHRAIGQPSPDERIAGTIAALAQDPDAFALPSRVSLFGHTRLPWGDLQVLAALAGHRDVHLWLPHASPAAWDRLAGDSGQPGVVVRADDTDAARIANPLLAALGRDSRELQRSLTAAAPAAVQHVAPPVQRPDTVLGRVQADLVADRDGRGGPPAATDDRSLQVHACHGPTRQVEVLRDVVVGLLQDDPTLEPRDIVVMVPDVETYAPLFEAAFGLADLVDAPHHPGHALRVMLADRAASRTNPLLALATELLEIAQRGRLTNAEVLDLMSRAPVRRRFGLGDPELERITEWVEAAGVRWGLDAEHRRRFGLPIEQNSWRAGLDRLVAGVVATEDPARPVQDVLPLDDVPSGDVDLAGRLVTFVDALTAAVDAFAGEMTMAQWSRTIAGTLTALADVAPDDRWQRQQVDRELDDLDDEHSALGLGEVLTLVRERWAGRPSRASFRTGTLTVCTLVPMRSVPHRVVCLVGLDDGHFPRTSHPLGDDVLARTPLTGERDPRAEDRQLLLDAVMSATQTLVVTFTGADERRGRPRPPAVPLGELLDQVARTTGEPVRIVHHPLQPFDPRNLEPGALVADGRPFSFDPAALAGARAGRHPRREPAGFLTVPLAPAPPEDLTLSRLEAFVQNPPRDFWRSRLGVSLRGDDDLLDEDLPITLDGLQRWAIGQRLLDDAIAGVSAQDAWAGIRRRGMLPAGELGQDVVADVGVRVATLVERTADLRAGVGTSVDIDLVLPDGRRLTGTIEGIHGTSVVTVSYSSVRPKHRLRDWVRLLALTAHEPAVEWTFHTAGKIDRGTARLVTGPLTDPADAVGLLGELVDLRDDGLTRPLPLPVDLSYRFARALRARDARQAAWQADREWTREPRSGGPAPERDAEEIVRAWGPRVPYQRLVDDGFESLAPRLWNAAMDHQREASL